MAKNDWTISGSGGLSIIDDGGSKRCRLTSTKLMVWNGNTALGDCEVVVEIQLGSGGNFSGGVLLRTNSSATTAYRLLIVGSRTYYIQKIVNGIATTLGTVVSTRPYNEFTKTRFRIDEFQISVEEYINGAWTMALMVQDSSQAIISGGVGLFGESVSSGYYITFDNLEVNIKS